MLLLLSLPLLLLPVILSLVLLHRATRNSYLLLL
jgi:hypothetical protein